MLLYVYVGSTRCCWQNWKGGCPRTQRWKGKYILHMKQFLICIQIGHFFYWKAILLKGSDGAHGSQGPPGPPGSPGSPGLMVYACFCILSLFNSFQHISELSALLHSLCLLWKGPPGIEGMDGKDGKSGLRVSYTQHMVGSRTRVII